MPKRLQAIFIPRNRRRLLYRLLFAVVFCGACFTLLATVIQLYFSFRADLDAIDRHFEFIPKSYLPAISASVYKVNIEQLKIQLKGIVQLTDMVYAEVREPRGEDVFILSEGDAAASREIVHEYPLSYQQPSGRIIRFGKLLVAANLDDVRARLWDRVIVILATNGAKMFLTSFCILLIFHFLLIRHIARITQYVSGWAPDKPSGELFLERPGPRTEKPDELDHLVDSINEMRCNILEYIAERQTAVDALKTSENQLRLITDSLPVMISYVDMELRYRFNNRAYYEWFGVEQDRIVGHHVEDILGKALFEKVQPYMVRALRGEQINFETELYKKGKSYLFDVTYVPHTAREGKASGFYVLGQDLSGKKQKEMELQRHREELAHVSRLAAMGELTASMAHELNQPLTAILSNAQAALRFMEKDPVDMNEIKDILTDIASDDRRASEVIKRLRGFLSRGETLIKIWNMNDIIRDVVPLVNSDAVMRKVSIQIHLEPDLPAVSVDRVQMQQILLNLMINGLDAIGKVPEDSRKLIITTRKQEQYVLVTVADSGIGIEDEQMERIFEPFFTTKAEGMGMGLSINRSIIEAHNGKIWAENNPDGGAIFSFSLPIKDQTFHEEMNEK